MYQYLIALGSNQRHVRYSRPRKIFAEAIIRLEKSVGKVTAVSNQISSQPVGPSRRRYVNAAIIVETSVEPLTLLNELKKIEFAFGKRRGQRWSRRVLDLDIILWTGGMFSDANGVLTIPHRYMRERAFVIGPAARIAPDWRDPVSRLTLAQLHYRLRYAKISMNPA